MSLAWAFAALLAAAQTDSVHEPAVQTVSLATGRFAYVEAGEGEPILLVHGGFQDYRLWLPHLPALARGHRVVAYSRRNHHPNPSDPDGLADTAAAAHADDVAALVRALGRGPVHVVAHSSGAYAALFFAARHPQLLRRLVVVEPPAPELIDSSSEGRAAIERFNRPFGAALAALRGGDLATGTRLFAEAVGGPGGFERRSETARRMMLDNAAAHAAVARSHAPRERFSCAIARQIGAPTLIVSGARSPAYFHLIAAALARCMPTAQRTTLAASHSVPAETPEAFVAAVRAFLDGETARPPSR